MPIWPFSAQGLPCLFCYQKSGELLPRHFTLTPKSGLFSVALSITKFGALLLAGALPYAARTFLLVSIAYALDAKRSADNLATAYYSNNII